MLRFDRQGFVAGVIIVKTMEPDDNAPKNVGVLEKIAKRLRRKPKVASLASPSIEKHHTFLTSDRGKCFQFTDEESVLERYPHLFTKADQAQGKDKR